MSFRNIRDEGIQKVANASDRLALLPDDGTIVEQLDTHTLYIYKANTDTWEMVGGGGGGGGNSFGTIQTDTGTYPTAEVPNDTLTLISADNTRYYFSGNALTDRVTLHISGLIPSGGNDGQALVKASNSNFDVEWSDTSQVTTVYNKSGAPINKGSVVYINGAHGNLPTIALSQANAESVSSKTYGFVVNTISDMSSGTVVHSGKIGNLDTFGISEGVTLWLSPTIPGGYTTTKPSAPDHTVALGVCTRAHPTQGTIEVTIQNGFELQELHNVSISSPTSGQVLVYDSGTSLWKNSSATATLSLKKQQLVLTPTNISNGYINLSFLALANSIQAYVDRLPIFEGMDFTTQTIAGTYTRVIFIGDLVPGGLTPLQPGDVFHCFYTQQGS